MDIKEDKVNYNKDGKFSILSFTKEELEAELLELGEKKFRAGQVYEWLHQKNALSFDDMSNISIDLREKLKDKYFIDNITVLDKLESKMDETKKFILKLDDGNIIEAVVMKYKYGNSICISSEVGCQMGCTFCASTKQGYKRNLRAGEMLKEIYMIQDIIGERIGNVVIMGIGEPLMNYDNVVHFLKNIINPKGLNIGARHVTLSTCGIVPRIKQLADERMQINLAISLHASNDEIRKKLMPIANKFSISELLDACKYYCELNNRRMNFEYALIAGENDKDQNAEELANLLKDFTCFVNLIPVNEIKENNYKRTSKEATKAFQEKLNERGIDATIRRELGTDIEAACGQLRNKYMEESENN
ncbi:MAG: 23S rRNA (adenine(2503)-C(2))-methyltransferase RlmN [Clostridia bacterium]|nr:23S rRNA (adenine(2503)-C(2))-methyltransferase RlmN [Clostridia bacterium]